MTDSPDARMRRRGVLTASLGALAVATAACSTPRAAPVTPPLPHRNIRDFGAAGDGATDDTAAVAAAFRADGPVAVFFPAGTYAVSAWPEMHEHSVVFGDGADLSTLLYRGDGPLITIAGKQRIAFKSIGFYAVGPTSTCVRLTQAFRCSFDTVMFRGQHTSSASDQYKRQTGIILEGDSGGTTFNNCDINNFGRGLVTSCIQNYVSGSRFTTNHIGVLGTGNNRNAGLAMTNVEFVSTVDATEYHVLIDGAANDWWLTNVWLEGCQYALKVGAPGVGGPSQFGMVNCKVAAQKLAIDLQHCRQPYLANVVFDADRDAAGRRELQINAQHCPEGTAIGLISSAGSTIAPNTFPGGWNVLGRAGVELAPFTDTVVAQTPPRVDAFQARTAEGDVRCAITGGGDWVSTSAQTGVVLRSPNGTYWRLSVSDAGEVTARNVGPDRPA
ncbi:mannuronan epimerase [Mycobacterium sp. PS03-16]|uniref:glycosyl hydrolase family 28-related protein n=1 Tax=Mycobacterium sp. PS03-16 TaxID=2559611 RepID=UPI0010736439|nr:glycosyl hydrolase family 28-related protein [Mycobacterium sp. PS03-16]TFV58656.1 mannuronan epimerase [Mycobacterium sp. PS03-16]